MTKFVEEGKASVSNQGELETSEFNGDSWANPDSSSDVTTDSQGRLRLAEAKKIIDDFEDGDISEYGGDTGKFTVQQNTVLSGQNTLKGSTDNGNFIGIASTSGLANYPSEGDVVRARIRSNSFTNDSSAIYVRVGMFSQSESALPNGYEFTVSSDGSFYIGERDSGGPTRLASQNLTESLQDNTQYEMEMKKTTGGDLEMEVFKDDTGDGNFDTSISSSRLTGVTPSNDYTSGGVLMFMNTANDILHNAYWDNIRIV